MPVILTHFIDQHAIPLKGPSRHLDALSQLVLPLDEFVLEMGELLFFEGQKLPGSALNHNYLFVEVVHSNAELVLLVAL